MKELEFYIKETFLLINSLKKIGNKAKNFEIDELFIENFEKKLNDLKNLGNEQKIMMTKYKSKTAQVDEKIDELNEYIKKAKELLEINR